MVSPEAQALLQDPAVDEANWGFQIQQAVEKALKAWLCSLGEELSWADSQPQWRYAFTYG